MSPRVTRSTARQPANPSPADLSSSDQQSRKRKAPSKTVPSDPLDSTPSSSEELRPIPKRPKRGDSSPRSSKSRPSTMSSPKQSEPSDENKAATPTASSSKKKTSSKSKKTSSPIEQSTSSDQRKSSSSSSRKRDSGSRKTRSPDDEEMADAPEDKPAAPDVPAAHDDDDDDENDEGEGDEQQSAEDDDEQAAMEADMFMGSLAGAGHGPLAAMRAITGLMSGMSSRLRKILEDLRRKNNPDAQYTALTELSELLLVSTEDTLAGHFSPDLYVKELVALMKEPEDGSEGNQEIITTACRCIANMIEALPPSTATVVYNGAVPVLVEKLLNIMYMDLAEQALTTLEKISVDFPAAIVRAGGLAACLQYLDFFPTAVQRSAVTTAANCCRSIPEDCLSNVKDVMQNLQNVLGSSDQRVVESGSLCISRIANSFKYNDAGLEQLMTADILKAVLRLLVPGATNLVSPHIHTQFVGVLSTVARASPSLTGELFKMNITDTLYQILTGVSPPSDDSNVAQQIDSVMVMQALIHRPRDQVYESLNVICELLPGLDRSGLGFVSELSEHVATRQPGVALAKSKKAPINKRREILSSCKPELRRFAMILLPTLTDAYSSTVNFNVRQRVLIAQLKMLCNLDQDILEDALRPVPYASFLASILSQPDHPTLVTTALQAADLLLKRLPTVYQHQFYREGVIAEIKKLSERPLDSDQISSQKASAEAAEGAAPVSTEANLASTEAAHVDDDDDEGDDDDDGEDDEDEDDEDGAGHEPDGDASDGDHDSEDSDADEAIVVEPASSLKTDRSLKDMVTSFAKQFIAKCDTEAGAQERRKALQILGDLNALVTEIADAFDSGNVNDGKTLFSKLAKSFEGSALESITSYELISSNVLQTLLEILDPLKGEATEEARTAFVQCFMGSESQTSMKTGSSASPSTAFSVLVQKLQDLLSRAEHFEVITVNSSPSDHSRGSAASMLAKQVRIKLVADGDDSDIPPQFRNIMVSIHAIATLQALDEYLRPRMSISERERSSRTRHATSSSSSPSGRTQPMITPEELLTRRLASTPGPPQGALGSETSQSSSTRSKDKRRNEGEDAPSTPSARRRSSRKDKTVQPDAPNPPSTRSSEGTPLECADEAPMDEDDPMDEDEDLNAVVEEFEEETEDHENDDPSAVSMELGSSGKVTARQDDGTRISTPTQSQSPVPGSGPGPGPFGGRGGPGSLARSLFAMNRPPMSYSAAIQAVPTDWHLEFSVNGRPISSDTTIYRAVHGNQAQTDEVSGRSSSWNNTHPIAYKKVQGPPPPPTERVPAPASSVVGASGLPQSLDQNPTTAVILRLLNILHGINANVDEVLGVAGRTASVYPEPLSQFVNTKLTAKMNRQLEEPLIVASNSLPGWSEDLARLYPFLFPFETRHLFLQSTSFGYSRSITRWQNAQPQSDSRHRHRDERPYLGRLQRQKVRISRQRILESAMKVMELYGASPSILEVEYFDEVGTGLGPTLEFYSNVSREFSNKKLQMWRYNEAPQAGEYAFGKRGLFPAPMTDKELNQQNGQRMLALFRFLGKFMARSMLDSRIIDLFLNPTFFKVNDEKDSNPLTLATVKSVDEDLANSLQTLKQFVVSKKKILEQDRLTPVQKAQKLARVQVSGASLDDMSLDFTLPGYPSIELVDNGSNTSVSIDNVDIYIEKVIEWTLSRGIHRQLQAFRDGFSQVFPYSALRAFTPDELCMLFGRAEEDWTLETLMDSIKADHGYNLDSPAVRNLLTVMSNLDAQNRRNFLQFVTGSPKLPIGGFKSLTPMFTVVTRPAEAGHKPDEYLPSCMTCVNYLKMPNYSSLEVMQQKLGVAIMEGQGAFHLS